MPRTEANTTEERRFAVIIQEEQGDYLSMSGHRFLEGELVGLPARDATPQSAEGILAIHDDTDDRVYPLGGRGDFKILARQEPHQKGWRHKKDSPTYQVTLTRDHQYDPGSVVFSGVKASSASEAVRRTPAFVATDQTKRRILSTDGQPYPIHFQMRPTKK